MGMGGEGRAYLAPARGPPGVAMLDEQVGGANLALGDARGGAGTGAGRVVGGHVVLELLGVGAGGGLPAGDLVVGVEVVREVFGVGVADLPPGGETSVSLWEQALAVSVERERVLSEEEQSGRTIVTEMELVRAGADGCG